MPERARKKLNERHWDIRSTSHIMAFNISELVEALKTAPVNELSRKIEDLEVSVAELLSYQKLQRKELKQKKKHWKRRALAAETQSSNNMDVDWAGGDWHDYDEWDGGDWGDYDEWGEEDEGEAVVEHMDVDRVPQPMTQTRRERRKQDRAARVDRAQPMT